METSAEYHSVCAWCVTSSHLDSVVSLFESFKPSQINFLFLPLLVNHACKPPPPRRNLDTLQLLFHVGPVTIPSLTCAS